MIKKYAQIKDTTFGDFPAAIYLVQRFNDLYPDDVNLRAYISSTINDALSVLNKLAVITDGHLRRYLYVLHRKEILSRIDKYCKNKCDKTTYTFTRNVLIGHFRKFTKENK